jgi:SAM-dependent methyltransferase
LVTLEADHMIANLVREELLPDPDDTFLDLGCGPGLAAQRLAARVNRYVGLDVSLPALALARQRVGSATNVAFLPLNAANPEDLSIVAGQRFSYILCHSVIQYLPDEASLRRLLDSLRGVAAPNARIVIGDVPVRGGFVGEAFLIIAQAMRAGALTQILLGLTRRLFDRAFWRATKQGITFASTARLAEAASAAGFTAEIRPAPGRPPGRRVLLLCRPKPKSCAP